MDAALAVIPPIWTPQTPTATSTACRTRCMTSGLWLEGTMKHGTMSGIWLQTERANVASGGVAFVSDTSVSSQPSSSSSLAAAGIFHMGLLPPPTDNVTALPTVVNRSMHNVIAAATPIRFRLVLRYSWTEASIVEFYCNDVLGQAFNIGNRGAPVTSMARLTGVFVATAVHRLTLPEQPMLDDESPCLRRPLNFKMDDMPSSLFSSMLAHGAANLPC